MDGVDDGDFDDSVDEWMEHADDPDMVDDELVCKSMYSHIDPKVGNNPV